MRFLWVCMTVILAGCAPYQPACLFGGYSETRLSGNSYKVFAESGTEEIAKQVLELRAAELTLQNGFQKFQTVSRSMKMEQHVNHIPGHSYVNATVDARGHSTGTTMITSPPRTEIIDVAKGEMTIKMFKASDPGAAKAEEAAAVRARLEPVLKGG